MPCGSGWRERRLIPCACAAVITSSCATGPSYALLPAFWRLHARKCSGHSLTRTRCAGWSYRALPYAIRSPHCGGMCSFDAQVGPRDCDITATTRVHGAYSHGVPFGTAPGHVFGGTAKRRHAKHACKREACHQQVRCVGEGARSCRAPTTPRCPSANRAIMSVWVGTGSERREYKASRWFMLESVRRGWRQWPWV